MGTREINSYEHKCDRCWHKIADKSKVPPTGWVALEYVGSSSGFAGSPRVELFCTECMKVLHPIKPFEIQVALTQAELACMMTLIDNAKGPTEQSLRNKAVNAFNALVAKDENGTGKHKAT
jgi:hypothetical protein